MPEAWLSRTVDDFWAAAGGAPPFPRDLDAAVQFALPASLHPIAGLDLRAVERELARLGLDHAFGHPNRPLRGCLVAHRGRGLVFVDDADPPDDRRFTLAHEAAHLICDHLVPRERAVARLGPSIVPVLDGDRPPTRTDRLDAALAGLTFGVQAHLLDRDQPPTIAAESRADRLAIELLAPFAELARRLGPRSRDPMDQAELARWILIEHFGLPGGVTHQHARRIGRATARVDRLAARLRGKLSHLGRRGGTTIQEER